MKNNFNTLIICLAILLGCWWIREATLISAAIQAGWPIIPPASLDQYLIIPPTRDYSGDLVRPPTPTPTAPPFPPEWLATFTTDELERLAIRTLDGGLTDQEALQAENWLHRVSLARRDNPE
jgi:hypothetical protein